MSRTLRSATKGLPKPSSVSPRSPFSAAAIACLQDTLLPPDVTTRMQALAAVAAEDEIDEEPDEYDKGYQDQDDLDSDSDDEEDDNDEDGAGVSNEQDEEMDVDNEEMEVDEPLPEEAAKKKPKTSEARRAAALSKAAKQQRKRKIGPATTRDKHGKFAGPKGPVLRKRDKVKEIKAYDRERKRQSRKDKKEKKLEFLNRGLKVLDDAVLFARIQPLIHTDVDQFEAAGFESKIHDFGSSKLLPYRKRALALHVWHKHVLAHDGADYEGGYAAAAAAGGITPGTMRKWVRSFHHLGFKIARLVVGLNKKTSSYLDDEDIQRTARRYLQTHTAAAHRQRMARAVARRKKELIKHVTTFAEKAARTQETGTSSSSSHCHTHTTHAASTEVNLDLCICGEEGADDNMIMCGECERWHHPGCVGLNSRDFRAYKRDGEDTPWYCNPCWEKIEREEKEEEESNRIFLESCRPIPSDGKAGPEIFGQLTGARFLQWVNTKLLAPIIEQGGKPICEATAKAWLRKLGYIYRKKKTIVYIDGHERKDVVEYRKKVFLPAMAQFQQRMRTYEGEDCMKVVLPNLVPGERELVLVVHDECAVACKDGTISGWMSRNNPTPLPKSKGPCLMVSEFLSEMIGRLRLSEKEWDEMVDKDPDLCKELRTIFISLNKDDLMAHLEGPSARVLLETGKGRDGYWTGNDLVEQVMKLAIKFFELTHGPDRQALFLFDNSKCHGIMASDSLDSRAMNLNPGGKQPKMRKGWYMKDGVRVEQSMVFEDTDIVQFSFSINVDGKKYSFKQGDAVKGTVLVGQPKGMRHALWERGLWTDSLKGVCVKQPKRVEGEEEKEEEEEVHKHAAEGTENHGRCCATMLMSQQPDFQEQKCWLEEIIKAAGHEIIFLPKFHPELNFIERYWGRTKKWLHYHCDETWASLRLTLVHALDNEKWCSLSLLRKYARVCWRYMDAYRKGYTGALAAYAVKTYKHHRGVCAGLDKIIDAAALDGFLGNEVKEMETVAHVEDEEGAGEGAE